MHARLGLGMDVLQNLDFGSSEHLHIQPCSREAALHVYGAETVSQETSAHVTPARDSSSAESRAAMYGVECEDDLLTGSDCSSTVVGLDDYDTHWASDSHSRSQERSSQIHFYANVSEEEVEQTDRGQHVGGRYSYHDVR